MIGDQLPFAEGKTNRMIDYPTIIFAALLIFFYGLVSRLSEKSPITAPMVFAGIGILASPMALNLLDVKPQGPRS